MGNRNSTCTDAADKELDKIVGQRDKAIFNKGLWKGIKNAIFVIAGVVGLAIAAVSLLAGFHVLPAVALAAVSGFPIISAITSMFTTIASNREIDANMRLSEAQLKTQQAAIIHLSVTAKRDGDIIRSTLSPNERTRYDNTVRIAEERQARLLSTGDGPVLRRKLNKELEELKPNLRLFGASEEDINNMNTKIIQAVKP